MGRKRSFGNYFSFRYLITPDIIKIFHVTGFLLINLATLFVVHRRHSQFLRFCTVGSGSNLDHSWPDRISRGGGYHIRPFQRAMENVLRVDDTVLLHSRDGANRGKRGQRTCRKKAKTPRG